MAEKSTHPPLLFPLPPPRSTRRNEKIEKKEAEEEGAFIRRAKGPLPFPFWETLDARKMPGAFQRRRERDAGNILRPLDLGFLGLDVACEIGFFSGCKEGEVSFFYYLAVFSGKLDAIGRRNSSLSLSPSVASSEDGKSPCVIRIFFLLRIFPPFFPLFVQVCVPVRRTELPSSLSNIRYYSLRAFAGAEWKLLSFLPLLLSASSELHLIKREGHKKR